ncbi:MAG: MarR family winged helix-turn-helix transcriptional regulator [Sandaracinaceae bacterium]
MATGTEKTEIADAVLRSLRQIIRRVAEHSKDLAREAGLTLPQLLCLKAIGSREDAPELTVAMVAADVQLSPPTVSRIVDRLERAGLVTRERRARDRRKVCLALTPKGYERYLTLPVPLQDRFLERLMQLEEERRLELLAALRRIVELMDAGGIDAAPMLTPGSDVKDSRY